jgi:hypothetical protein
MRAMGVMCLGAAVLAVAACDRGGETGEGTSAAGGTSTSAPANAGPAAGGGTTLEAVKSMMAKRRAGKWQMSMGSGAGTTPPQEICITEEQNREQPAWDPMQAGAGCPDFRSRRQGDAIVMTANCPTGQGAGSVQMESRIIGDFQSSYRIESTIRQNPAPAAGPAEMRTFLDMKYLGPC